MVEPARTLERTYHFQGKRVTLRTDRFAYPDGSVHVREIVEHPNSVCVVPVDDHGNVLLVRQWRTPVDGVLLEIPAGVIEHGEEPIVCAQRELREETGFSAARLVPLGDFYAAPGTVTERLFAFLATGLRHDPLNADDDERIDLVRLPFKQALAMARRGELHDGKSIAGIAMAAPRVARMRFAH
ncbi:MAG: NUDIX hydrolase [SAR202 cluster bacterium]|nr:NUDIX hydrolase [SAR202 cluster bacterium]